MKSFKDRCCRSYIHHGGLLIEFFVNITAKWNGEKRFAQKLLLFKCEIIGLQKILYELVIAVAFQAHKESIAA